jgi:hypothetical protein
MSFVNRYFNMKKKYSLLQNYVRLASKVIVPESVHVNTNEVRLTEWDDGFNYGSSSLNKSSIYGMPGSGKTTVFGDFSEPAPEL